MTDANTGLDIRVQAGTPTAAELAAVHAVLGAAVQELSDDSKRITETGPSRWERSQRSVRSPLPHGADTWRSFGA
ncbi:MULTISPECIES: acyl-CoA carboxylase subunit epsilon [unclassified Salinibacterium]|uniref:acyl-CoA carboxylase subunit epsilon n=1 Tax=unclassified Salinibacterium TaxID=2632331 RepID=UPI00142123E3|nr:MULTISPECIES: acyl-CoA carboxylase subunit epsilon [unclassified Salinibacterium]